MASEHAIEPWNPRMTRSQSQAARASVGSDESLLKPEPIPREPPKSRTSRKRKSAPKGHGDGPALKKPRGQVKAAASTDTATPKDMKDHFASIAQDYTTIYNQLQAAEREIKGLKAKQTRTESYLKKSKEANLKKQVQLTDANRKLRTAEAPGRQIHLNNGSQNREKALGTELKRLQDEHAELTEQHFDLQSELCETIQKQNQDPGYHNEKVSDDYITQTWGEMVFAIQQLPTQSLNNNPNGRELPVVPCHPTDVASLLDDITKNPPLIGYYIQRHVWSFIYSNIFMGDFDAWGGIIGSAFLRFTQALHENIVNTKEAEAFSFVKGRASSLLDQVFEKHKRPDLDKLIQELGRDLSIFIAPGCEVEFHSDMEQILAQACELQRIFIMSRAFLVPRWILPGSELDQDQVVIQHYPNAPEGKKYALDIIVSPYLEKIGTADGWKFEQRRVLCRAHVTVKSSDEDSSSEQA